MTFSKTIRAFCYLRDNHKCLKCGTRENLTVDHIIPKSRGGNNSFVNLQTLCLKCNAEKKDNIIQYSNSKATKKMIRNYFATGGKDF